MKEKIFLSWRNLESDTLSLCKQIKNNIPSLSQVNLVCISRGGLFPGAIAAYSLGVKKIHCVSLESYYSDQPGANRDVNSLTDFLPSINKDETYLFIDDINDTSDTYRFVKNKCDELGIVFYFAVTYHKEKTTNLIPDFIGQVLEDKWVVFPWDRLDLNEV